MENLKKNPVLWGILNCVGSAVLLLAVYYVLSLFGGKSFSERLSDPINIIILIVGPIASGITSFTQAKKKLEEKDKKEM